MGSDTIDSGKADQIIVVPNDELLMQEITFGTKLNNQKRLDSASHKSRELRLKSGDPKSKQHKSKVKKIIKVERKVKRKKKKRLRNCTTRIAELALPNKRQCIETQRTMGKILSPYKLEYLRDTITDARPLVSVSEAFTLFKCCSRRFRKKRGPKVYAKKAIKHDDAKYLSALFGKNVYANLLVPKIIKMNPEMTKLHAIVLSDLKELFDCKKLAKRKKTKYLDEVSKQIVSWMTLILDEAYYKLVEDEIEDLDKEVHPLMDILYDVVYDKMHLKNSLPSLVTTKTSSSLVLESLMESEQIVRKILKDLRKRIDIDDGETSLDFSEADTVILEDADKLRTLSGNADESWPRELPPLSIKPSASVIQSITSLGQLNESDENLNPGKNDNIKSETTYIEGNDNQDNVD